MRKRAWIFLTVVAGFCSGGCMTPALWHESAYVTPAPIPNLALTDTPRGILAQYDAAFERNGDLRRCAYYVEPNLKQLSKGGKPAFVNPSKTRPGTPIPVFFTRPKRPPDLYAVCPANHASFTIYRQDWVLGPCDLPVFKDEKALAAKWALTPLAVIGDASLVGGCVWILYFSHQPADRPDP
jgi:hypothetical protein